MADTIVWPAIDNIGEINMGSSGDYKYSNEQLEKAVKDSKSYAEVLRTLGAHPENKYLKKRIREAKLDTSHWGGRIFYTREKLEKVVAECTTYADVVRAFGAKPVGGNLVCARKALKKFKIDHDHFTGQAHQKGKSARNKLSPGELLVLGDKTKVRVEGRRLACALKELGREYKCEICGLPPEWEGKPLTLTVDHINGKYWDNRKKNLRFVCPNCDRQLPTFGSKNRVPKESKKQKFYCDECGAEIIRGTKTGLCFPCHVKTRFNKNIPPIDILIEEVRESSYEAVGRKYNVTGAAIKRRIKTNVRMA